MVKQLSVVIHRSPTLLQIHKLLVLPQHDTYRHVLSTEGLVKLGPLHLVNGRVAVKLAHQVPVLPNRCWAMN
jgi:hypothetical protein